MGKIPAGNSAQARQMMTLARHLIGVFGCGLHEVDQMLIRIAMLEPMAPPAWLKNTRRLEDLPRFARQIDASGTAIFELAGLDMKAFTSKIVWVVDNLADAWWLDGQFLHLTSERDQVHFHLMWV